MATSLGNRLLLAALSTAVAVGAATLWLRTRRQDSIQLVDRRDEIDQLLARGAGGAPAAPGAAGLVRRPITAAEADLLFAIEPALLEFDPFCHYRHKGGSTGDRPWKEHPKGRFRIDTSLDGYREDFDRLRERIDLLVIATGDSNVDGLCDNAETFPNVLQARLEAQAPEKEIEVLNTGASGYSLYHYLGVLERELHRRPDAFVVALYAGNDFLDLVRLWHYHHGTAPPPRTKEYWQELTAAASDNPVLVGNAFNQLYYFLAFPEQIEVAMAASEQTTREIERLCAQHDVRLFYVLIPVGFPSPDALPADVAKVVRELRLSDEDLGQFGRLSDRFAASLRARGQDVTDLREHFERPIQEHYWSDWHIDLEGHELIAKLLEPKLLAAFPPKTIGERRRRLEGADR